MRASPASKISRPSHVRSTRLSNVFESAGDAAKREGSAGQRVLSEARIAREKLESAAAEPPCLRAKQEELVFLNHLILGFQAYIEAGSKDPKSLDSLESIIRRARVHQERGRTGL